MPSKLELVDRPKKAAGERGKVKTKEGLLDRVQRKPPTLVEGREWWQ